MHFVKLTQLFLSLPVRCTNEFIRMIVKCEKILGVAGVWWLSHDKNNETMLLAWRNTRHLYFLHLPFVVYATSIQEDAVILRFMR